MFAALSIKTTLFTVLLISLASISIAQEDKPIKFTLSIQKSIHHPQADIEFERTDSNIKWFNDNSLSTDSDLIFGLTIHLNQINLNYRKHTMRGTHSGEALKEVCILTSCFWVSSSLISGLESNDEVHYKIDNNELWIEKPLYVKSFDSLTISPLMGINVIPVKFIIKGENRQESKSATLPIPFWGINLEKQLSNTVKVTIEFHHLNYNGSGWGVLYKNYLVGIEKRMTKNIDISIGYSKYRLNTEFDKYSKDTKFNLSSDSPFIKISTRF